MTEQPDLASALRGAIDDGETRKHVKNVIDDWLAMHDAEVAAVERRRLLVKHRDGKRWDHACPVCRLLADEARR